MPSGRHAIRTKISSQALRQMQRAGIRLRQYAPSFFIAFAIHVPKTSEIPVTGSVQVRTTDTGIKTHSDHFCFNASCHDDRMFHPPRPDALRHSREECECRTVPEGDNLRARACCKRCVESPKGDGRLDPSIRPVLWYPASQYEQKGLMASNRVMSGKRIYRRYSTGRNRLQNRPTRAFRCIRRWVLCAIQLCATRSDADPWTCDQPLQPDGSTQEICRSFGMNVRFS